MRAGIACAVWVVACSGCGFQTLGEDAGQDADLGVSNEDLAGADLSGADLTRSDATVAGACRELILPCLDPAPANVIEVPGESTTQNAFDNAKSGDTIQIRGLSLGAGWRVPSGVTLRGCAGASLAATTAFVGSLGVVEGFTVTGTVIANTSGTFTIRYNRFTGGGTLNAPSVSARAIDGIVGATVNAIVDANLFESRGNGVEALTSYDTMMRNVSLTLRNNLFHGVDAPLYVSEGGLVGRITVRAEHNTFSDFKTAVALFSISDTSLIKWNVFAYGTTGIDGDSAYELDQSYFHAITTNYKPAPLTGAAQIGDPQFVDRANGDFHLGATSPLIDAIAVGAASTPTDYYGCPRPVAINTTPARGDPGAIETQP